MRSFDLKYSDLLNDDGKTISDPRVLVLYLLFSDLPDRSGVFYIKHGGSLTVSHLRDFLHTWNLLSHDRVDPTTYVVGLSMKNDTVETSSACEVFSSSDSLSFLSLVLTKLRGNDKNLIVTSYAEYHQLDASSIKVKEPNHLFDVDPSARKSNRRAYVDKDAAETTNTTAVSETSMTVELTCDLFFKPMDVTTPVLEPTAKPALAKRSYDDVPSAASASPTIAELIERKEKASGVKKQKLFEYNDEW